MATEFLIGTQRAISVLEKGYAYDIRPGVNPEDWAFTKPDGTPSYIYQWPVPTHVYHGNKKLATLPMPSPITLLPAILDPAWETTVASVGPHARQSLMEFNQTRGSWIEYPRLHLKDWVFVNKSGDFDNPAEITSIKPVPANRGICINFCAFGPALNQRTIISIDFGATNANKKFTLNINADGKGYLSRGNNPVVPLAEGYLVPNRWADVQGRWYKFFIMPIRRNRILFSSSTGGSFVWQDEDIPTHNTASPEEPKDLITALTLVASYAIRAHQKVAIQPNIMAFSGEATGTGVNKIVSGALTTLRNIFWNPRAPSLVDVAARNKVEYDLMSSKIKPSHIQVTYQSLIGGGGPAFQQNPPNPVPNHPVPNLGKERYALKPTVKLSRPNVAEEDKYHTPIFYRTEPSEATVPQVITASTEDIMPDIIEFNHNQDQKLMAGGIRLKNGHLHGTLKNVFNIPFQFKMESNTFLEGVLTKPGYDAKYQQQYLAFDLQDLMRWLDNTTVQDINRLDGLALDDAVKQLLISAGFPANGSKWDIDPTPSYVDRKTGITRKLIRLSKGEADDEPTNLSDVVKTVTQWLDMIVENYTSSSEFPFRWVYGFRPYFNPTTELYEYRFFFKDPAKMTQSRVNQFYATTDAAVSGLVAEGQTYANAIDNAYLVVHQNFKSYLIEPEANALLFVGMDELGNPISRYIQDSSSIDGSLAYESQPANWLGEKRIVVVIDSSFNTPELVTAGLGKMFGRISRTRQHIEFDAQWEPTIRMWDNINVQYYLADGTTLVNPQFRISGMSIRHLKDPNPGNVIPGIKDNMKVTYQAERWYDQREV